MQLTKGFTLIEILITVAIIGILLTVAYPSYINYVTKTHRTDGQVALMDLASRMERFYIDSNHTYEGASFATLKTSNASPRGFYNLAITNLSDTTFLLTATPTGTQATNDKLCSSLTIDQAGQKSQTGTGTQKDCW